MGTLVVAVGQLGKAPRKVVFFDEAVTGRRGCRWSVVGRPIRKLVGDFHSKNAAWR